MNIKDKIVIVTGASSGIGKATAELLTSKGTKVALASRSTEKLIELSKKLPGSFVVPVDMTKTESIIKMIEDTKQHYGRIDILVNNAGRGGSWENVENININDFEDLLELNVMGPIVAMQQVIPIMREQNEGVIINIGSGTVKTIREGGSVYPGTKILLQYVSKVARKELEKDNIVVSIIHPFITKTNFFTNMERKGSEVPSITKNLIALSDEPEKVADSILSAIETGIEEIDMTVGKIRST